MQNGRNISGMVIMNKGIIIMGINYKPLRVMVVDGVEYFKCPRCGEWMTKDKYYKNTAIKYGIDVMCKECRKEYKKGRKLIRKNSEIVYLTQKEV